jgi:farnesyl-diphosphate farnesyltransferase
VQADRQGRADIATPSGKNRHTENFPVGSWLVRRELRRHVHAFYRYARMGDDIADNPALEPQEKIRRLDRMEEVLRDDARDDVPVAAAMRTSLIETGVTPQHCCELLVAFRRDATKKRYADWGELLDYCRYSAAPVGRYLLDLHGEARESWPASDALCAALQIINHLQDCREDAQVMDRIYIPMLDFSRHGLSPAVLAERSASPALRTLLDELLDRTDQLMAEADHLPGLISDWRMRAEAAVIVALAHALIRALRTRDPLAEKVKLERGRIAVVALRGLLASMRRR